MNLKALISKLVKLSLVVVLATTCASQSVKAAGEIGVVDSARIIEQYSESKDAQKKILDSRDKLQKTFADLTTDLEKSLQDKNLSEAQKLQKRKDAQDKLEVEKKKLDQMIETARTTIETKIEKAINEEAKAQNLSMVVAKNVTSLAAKILPIKF
jgi:Skp family chaperone for outer membrane proteins